MIKKHLLKHIHYYTALLAMQVLGFIVMLSLSGNHDLQIAMIIVSTIGYVAWAILHQHLEHNLTSKIVVEYMLFGIFGIVVSLFFFR